jgi:hypothetical protein
MLKMDKDKLIFLLIGLLAGLLIGILMTSIAGLAAYKYIKGSKNITRYEAKKSAGKSAPLKEFYVSFEKKSDLDVFQPSENTTVELSQENTSDGKNSLMVRIKPGAGYPGLSWEVYERNVLNWSNAKDFHFDVYNSMSEDIMLQIKFKSGQNYPKKSYAQSVLLNSYQMNHVSIPMENIASHCDVTQMSYVKIYVQSPNREIVLYVDNIGTKEGDASQTKRENTVASKDNQSAKENEKELKVFAASSLDRIFRDGNTLVKPSFSSFASISLAKNEYESFQVVVSNGRRQLRAVRLEISDLVDEQTGAQIEKKNTAWRVVGYIPTEKPWYPAKYVGLWPDPLLPAQNIDIDPFATQPFWITVYIPRGTQAGVYNGEIKVISGETELAEVPVAVKIYDFTLPTASHLKTAFDMYPHILQMRYPQRKKESDEMYAIRLAQLNDRYLIDMLKHRMNPILNIDPRSELDLRMVERYRLFGLTNFSIGKKGGTFRTNWPRDDEEIEELLPLYRTYGENLKIHKMLDYHYIYAIDEIGIGNELTPKVCSMLHRAHPELKNLVTGHGFWEPGKDPDWGKDIDIWCFQINYFNEQKLRALQDLGIEMWMFISGPGNEGTPNLAIDFDSIDYRIAPWLCWKYEIRGFLYWCVNWWPYVDPFESGANTKWEQNGNGILYYPGEDGPIASLRIEIFRDGMEDFEYLVLLSKKLAVVKQNDISGKYQDIVERAASLLTVDKSIATNMRNFTKDNDVLLQRRNEIAETIEEIESLIVENSTIVAKRR